MGRTYRPNIGIAYLMTLVAKQMVGPSAKVISPTAHQVPVGVRPHRGQRRPERIKVARSRSNKTGRKPEPRPHP